MPEGMLLLWRMWMPTTLRMLRVLMMRGVGWWRRIHHRHFTILRRLSRGRGLEKGWEVPSDTVHPMMIRTR